MLKHITRIEVKSGYLGHTIYRLIDDEGQFIDGFDRFNKYLVDNHYPFSTRKRYSEAASRVIDYFIEIGILGKPVTDFEINQAIDLYPFLLRDGPNIKHEDIEKAEALRSYAKAIGMKGGLSGKSFGPTLAAVNLLLRIAQDLANEAIAEMKWHGVDAKADDYKLLIKAIDGSTALSIFEKKRLKQNSLLGSVIRMRGKLERPRGISSPIRNSKQVDLERLDFPLSEFGKLIEAATSYRDKARYALLGASGIRDHESLNLLLDHIDVSNQQVYVLDPDYTRFGRQMTRDEKKRFKGRVTSRTYLFEPLRNVFFNMYELYLRYEYVPTSEHDYAFQIIQGSKRGQPLKEASDTARNKSFKKTVIRAGITGPDIMPDYLWTIHSLRHMYGVYMLNYIPIPGGFGLLLPEVQMLMGHKDINSTRHYARRDEVILKAKLEAADRLIYQGGFDISEFPLLIANRLIAEAEALKLLVRRKDD